VDRIATIVATMTASGSRELAQGDSGIVDCITGLAVTRARIEVLEEPSRVLDVSTDGPERSSLTPPLRTAGA
jgi:hypothetical protein